MNEGASTSQANANEGTRNNLNPNSNDEILATANITTETDATAETAATVENSDENSGLDWLFAELDATAASAEIDGNYENYEFLEEENVGLDWLFAELDATAATAELDQNYQNYEFLDEENFDFDLFPELAGIDAIDEPDSTAVPAESDQLNAFYEQWVAELNPTSGQRSAGSAISIASNEFHVNEGASTSQADANEGVRNSMNSIESVEFSEARIEPVRPAAS